MARENPRYRFYGVDQQAYQLEKDRRVELKGIRLMGKYVLRHVTDPGSEYFARDCEVQAVEVIHSEIYRKVVLEAQGINEIDTCRFSKTFNHKGFITINLNPSQHTNKTEINLEAGYLLEEVVHDDYDQALKAYIMSGKPEEAKARS